MWRYKWGNLASTTGSDTLGTKGFNSEINVDLSLTQFTFISVFSFKYLSVFSTITIYTLFIKLFTIICLMWCRVNWFKIFKNKSDFNRNDIITPPPHPHFKSYFTLILYRQALILLAISKFFYKCPPNPQFRIRLFHHVSHRFKSNAYARTQCSVEIRKKKKEKKREWKKTTPLFVLYIYFARFHLDLVCHPASWFAPPKPDASSADFTKSILNYP